MEGPIFCFDFSEDDIVFIGDGPCASVALADASAADATIIMLRTRDGWKDRHPGTVVPGSVIYDTGVVPQNRENLECLERYLAGARIFLAGEIPRETGFRPPAIIHFRHAAWGESPRRQERRALEDVSLLHDFHPTSLHAVHVRARRRGNVTDPMLQQQLSVGWDGACRATVVALEGGMRPEFDPVREKSETAIVTHQHKEVVFGMSWLKGPFDTAYFDAGLAEGYLSHGIGTLVLDVDAILLGGDELVDQCGKLGLNLHTVNAGVQKRGRRGGQNIH